MEKHKSLFTWIIPVVFALAGTAWGNLIFLNEYLLSYRRFFASLIFFVILFLIAFFLLRKVPLQDRKFNPLLVWLIPALIAIALSLQFPGTLAFLETHDLEITAEPGKGAVVFLGINSGNNDISLSQVNFSEEWEYARDGYRTYAGGKIQWNGRVSSRPAVIVLTGPEMGNLQLTWDGAASEYSLRSDTSSQSPIITSLPIPWYFKLGYFLVSWVFFFLLLFILFLLFRSYRLEKNPVHRRGFWLKYALPVFLVSGFMLLVFYPGMMSGDSLVQWRQAHSLAFSNLHPVFHTLTILLAARIWDSPASSIVFQIIFLGLVFGWGLGNLVKRGLPEKAAWPIAILFAILPANMLFSVTLWKDVPYATSLFWFTLVLVEIYFSRGSWLKRPANMAAFILSGLLTTLFRHNGWPVILLSCLVLLWFERRFYRWVLPGVAAIFILRMLITGPLYKALNVSSTPATQTYAALMYHLAAHLHYGSSVSPQVRETMDKILPIKDWPYDPCTAVWTQRSADIDKGQLGRNGSELLFAAIKLFAANPENDLRAFSNLGAFVFRVNPNCNIYISPLYHQPEAENGANWIDYVDDESTVEAPALPGFSKPIARFYEMTTKLEAIRVLHVLFWQPAAYLFLFLFSSFGFHIFQKRWDFLVFLSPALFQTVISIFLSPAQQTRYQYGLIVISIYSMALFLWAYYDSKRAEKQLEET